MNSLAPGTILDETQTNLHVRKNRLPVIPKSALLADARGLSGLVLYGTTGYGTTDLMLLGASETGSPGKTEPGRFMGATDFGNAVQIDDVLGTINECEAVDFTGKGFSLVEDTDVKSYFLRYGDWSITSTEPAILEAVSLPPSEAEKIQQLFLRLEDENESEPDSWSAFDELEQAIKSFGITAIELLSKLIETTSSYTNAFIALDILGAMDHMPTFKARLSLTLNTLRHNHPSVRHGAINALGSLKSEESIGPLQNLIKTDYSSLNRKVAHRVLEIIKSTS